MPPGNVQRQPVKKPARPIRAGKPILHLTDPRLDFAVSVPLRKSYIVASSYRCGSTFLCKELWLTGLLGAPWEYLNPRKGPNANSIQDTMMKRLGASSTEDYIAKLVATRTSRNGVFGMKAHFPDFEATLKKFPGMREALAPTTYIFMERRDGLAQAVSMARAMQTHSWISLSKPDEQKLRYDRDLISQCLGKLEMQKLGWQRWFEANDINPFVVVYEEMTANPAGVVRSILEYLDVQDDQPNVVRLPPVEKQGDDTNKEWVERFKREVQGGVMSNEDAPAVKPPPGKPAAGAARGKAPSAPGGATGANFFDRYKVFARGKPPRPARLRRRYDAIVARNRALFRGASVLHVGSGDGTWCMAALDAGASKVTGIEPRRQAADNAKATFEKLGVDAGSYQFVASAVFPAVQKFTPGEFDLVLCTGFFEQADPRHFFDQVRRLRPKHVILDTAVMPGKNPVMRFVFKQRENAGAAPLSASIAATPSYELISLLCDIYGFRWETVDFQSLGISNWEGVRDYENDRRRTYVLQLAG